MKNEILKWKEIREIYDDEERKKEKEYFLSHLVDVIVEMGELAQTVPGNLTCSISLDNEIFWELAEYNGSKTETVTSSMTGEVLFYTMKFDGVSIFSERG